MEGNCFTRCRDIAIDENAIRARQIDCALGKNICAIGNIQLVRCIESHSSAIVGCQRPVQNHGNIYCRD